MQLAGSASSTSRSASVPPVDAPMHTTISVVRLIARPAAGGGSIASAVSLGAGPLGTRGLRGETRAWAAPFTVSQISWCASFRCSVTPTRGFR